MFYYRYLKIIKKLLLIGINFNNFLYIIFMLMRKQRKIKNKYD